MNTLFESGPGDAAGSLGMLGSQPAALNTQTGLALEGAMLAPAWDGQLLAGLAVAAGAALIALLLRLYLLQFAARPLDQRRYLWLPALLVGGGLGAALLLLPGHAWLYYLFPSAAISIVLAAFVDAQLSLLVAVALGLVVGYLADRSLAVAAYASVGGLVGVLSLGRTNRVNHILWSGVCVGLANTAVVLVWGVLAEPVSRLELARLLALAIANGLFSSSLALIGFFLVSALLGITTSLQLLDLAQPTHPLLQQLLQHAPGTYYHSLMVSNLAEQAAQRIGADVLLTRVGALYHDVGKLAQPEYFAENEPAGVNMHQSLEPRQSARIIVNHVPEGLRLARHYHLPGEVRRFIAEHHGTSLIQYFYYLALQQAGAAGQVLESDFRYPGPRPRSRETALVMLSDSCEATVRAEQPSSLEQIQQIVQRVVMERVNGGELNECSLTLHDVDQAQHAFVEVLHGAFHPRISYPSGHSDADLVLPAAAALPVARPQSEAAASSRNPDTVAVR